MLFHSLKSIRPFATGKKSKNFYEILKLPRTANPQQIKSSYYKLAKEYHPDTHQNSPNIAETFKEINQAYNILRDSEKRKEYDQQNFTPQGEKKQYKFYDTQHNYGYGQKIYRNKNPYNTTNPFQSSFNTQNPFRQSGANPYHSDFSSFYRPSSNSSSSQQSQPSSSQESNPQSWQQYVRQQHRKNVAQNRKIARNRLHQSNTIVMIILGVISVYIIGELTFKIYEFNNAYRVRTYAEKLDPRELQEYKQRIRQGMPRKDYY